MGRGITVWESCENPAHCGHGYGVHFVCHKKSCDCNRSVELTREEAEKIATGWIEDFHMQDRWDEPEVWEQVLFEDEGSGVVAALLGVLKEKE